MFVSLRDKFHSVQEGITASLRGLSESPRRVAPEQDSSPVNYGAGANLLHKYQSEWSEIHKMSESNAAKAQEVNTLITALDRAMGKQFASVSQLTVGLASLPQLLAGVQELMEDLGAMQQRVEDVEGGLMKLEDMVEVQELQEKQLDHRFQLAMYKEKKLSELEALRVNLVSTHRTKLAQQEQKESRVLKERQDTFEEAFKQDIQVYQQSGAIPRVKEVGRNVSLEEVTLEPDDASVLDKFLSEDGPKQKSGAEFSVSRAVGGRGC